MEKLQKHGFSLIFFLMVLVYHLGNAVAGRFLNPLKALKRNRLEVKLNQESLFALESRGVKPSSGVFRLVDLARVKFKPVDFAAGQIAQVGYSLRYLTHQVNQSIIYGPSQPLQKFVWRDDIQLGFPQRHKNQLRRLTKFVSAQISYLERHGVSVVVVPPPAQSSVHGEYFTPLPRINPFRAVPSHAGYDPTALYKNFLSTSPRHFVDVLSVLSAYLTSHPDAQLFGPFNSHWTSLGIALASDATISKLRASQSELPTFSIVEAGFAAPHYEHDFLQNLLLPEYFLKSLSRFQWAEPLYQLKGRGAVSRMSIPRIILAGSSYSTRFKGTPLSLGGMLAESLKSTLVDYSFDGAWASGGLEKMLAEDFHFMPGDLFVWEIPLKACLYDKKIPSSPYNVKIHEAVQPGQEVAFN